VRVRVRVCVRVCACVRANGMSRRVKEGGSEGSGYRVVYYIPLVDDVVRVICLVHPGSFCRSSKNVGRKCVEIKIRFGALFPVPARDM
jgi:hypothetical protein